MSGEEPVFLRALDADDLDRTWKWHNDPSLYGELAGAFRFVSRAAEQEWLKAACSYSQSAINLAICRRDTGEHIGNVYLRDIDWIARRAELHIFVGDESNRGAGRGQSALRQVARHAFGDLGLNRLFLLVLAENERAQRAYERAGFAVEGRLVRHAYKGGRFVDVVVMGMTAED